MQGTFWQIARLVRANATDRKAYRGGRCIESAQMMPLGRRPLAQFRRSGRIASKHLTKMANQGNKGS